MTALPSIAAALVLITAGVAAAEVRVAAAASVEPALGEIARRFEAASGHVAKLSYGSSGNLARQIARGAPFEIFLGADETFALRLRDQGLTQGEGAVYATGTLALFLRNGIDAAVNTRLDGLAEAARTGTIARFAIANPEHAPYGVIAREALERSGAWNALGPRLVTGTDAAQAAQFAVSGAADGALLPASLAKLATVAAAGRVIPVATDLYTPLRHRMALLAGAGPAAAALYRFILEGEAQAILQRHGLTPALPATGGP